MKIIFPLVTVLILAALAVLGFSVPSLNFVFTIVIPYLAAFMFFTGICCKIFFWAKVPVPFRIPTTCGQQKSLDWIKPAKFDNPYTKGQVIVRMFLEIVFFRSLLGNTKTHLNNGKLSYGPSIWLWLAALVFHYSFLVVLIRHLRFFTEPVISIVPILQNVDGFFQIGVPAFYITSFFLLAAVFYLFLRRIYSPQLRYISLANDYFPLFVIMGIALTGILLRHYVKTDIIAVKELTMGLINFKPAAPENVSYLFYIHFFFVCVLFAYFPFSKLMHMGGVFLSPTRNMVSNNRMKRHINPWNHPVDVHPYEEYEDEFREKMIKAGIPVDKKE